MIVGADGLAYEDWSLRVVGDLGRGPFGLASAV